MRNIKKWDILTEKLVGARKAKISRLKEVQVYLIYVAKLNTRRACTSWKQPQTGSLSDSALWTDCKECTRGACSYTELC